MSAFDRVMRLMLEPDEDEKGSQGVDRFPADAVIGLGFVSVLIIVVSYLVEHYLRLGGVGSLLRALDWCLNVFAVFSLVDLAWILCLG